MTRAQIKAYIRQLQDDVNGGYLTDTVLDPFIDRAQIELEKKLLEAEDNYYLLPVETSTFQNQANYVIPVDFFKLQRLEIVLSGTGPNENIQQLMPITLNQKNLVSLLIGTPSNYTLKRNRLVLYPIPDNTYVLRLYYSYLVSSFTSDNQEVDAPTEYHDYVALFASRLCRIKDGADYADINAEIERYEALFKQVAQDRQEDVPRMVRVTTQDWYPGSF